MTDGQTTLTYAATDRAGNSETPKTLVIDLDQTPPTIAASHTPAPNALGWNNTDVTVSFACADTPSGVASCPSPTIISAEGARQNATGTVVDEAGNSTTTTVTGISIDKTAPTVTYAGNAGSYGVLSTVTITCAATDDPGGSGIASTTCQNVNGPAYSFSTGTNSFAASAMDAAGNVGRGSTNFTLLVTTGDLCTLTSQFVQSSARYQALPPDERLKINQIASALCRSLPSGQVAVAPTQKAQLLEAYRNGVSLLVSQGWLTAADGATLVRLSGAL